MEILSPTDFQPQLSCLASKVNHTPEKASFCIKSSFTKEGIHVMSHQAELAAGTPTEWQKEGDEWQRWLQYQEMGKSRCVIDCRNGFEKQSELSFLRATERQRTEEQMDRSN